MGVMRVRTERGCEPDPLENEQLLRTFRSFLTHAKSNPRDYEQLETRLHPNADGPVWFRNQAFLRLFTAIARVASDQWSEATLLCLTGLRPSARPASR